LDEELHGLAVRRKRRLLLVVLASCPIGGEVSHSAVEGDAILQRQSIEMDSIQRYEEGCVGNPGWTVDGSDIGEAHTQLGKVSTQLLKNVHNQIPLDHVGSGEKLEKMSHEDGGSRRIDLPFQRRQHYALHLGNVGRIELSPRQLHKFHEAKTTFMASVQP
jgi:hypothetical protein